MRIAVTTLALFLSTPAPPPHAKPFWRAIVTQKFELPPGETAPALAQELVAALGSPDPEMRDDLGFTILSSWIYTKKFLGPAELRPIVKTLQVNLKDGIGGGESDRVLLRSFSALTLSTVAARNNVDPVLSAEEYNALLDSALTYFHDEIDLRGFDEQKRWMHTAAHTADLLKFLARSPALRVGGQARILDALTAKNRHAPAAFTQGEDERIARVVISIVRRDDFDRDGFKNWLAAAQAAAKFPSPAAVSSLRAQQNIRHLLSSLWTELSVDERPSAGAEFARTALRDTLKTLF